MKRTFFALSTTLLLLGLMPALVMLESTVAVAQTKRRFKLPRPPRRGAPSTNAAGASRTDIPLTALVPIGAEVIGGHTTSAQPTFWFYNPYVANPSNPQTQSKLVELELILNDVDDRVVDSMSVPLPETAGILGVRLNNLQLKPDRPYRWILRATVEEPGTEVPKILTVTGWVQRELPQRALADALKTADEAEQFKLYRQHEMWFDALTVLAAMRSRKPDDQVLQAQWRELLKDAGIEQTVIDCSLGSCKAQPIPALF
jgi:hypothetical protein